MLCGEVQLVNRKGEEETRRGDTKRRHEARQGAGRRCESGFYAIPRARIRVESRDGWKLGRQHGTQPGTNLGRCSADAARQRAAPVGKGIPQKDALHPQ